MICKELIIFKKLYLIAAFTVFDTRFLVYTFLYTLIAIMGVVLGNLVLKMFGKP